MIRSRVQILGILKLQDTVHECHFTWDKNVSASREITTRNQRETRHSPPLQCLRFWILWSGLLNQKKRPGALVSSNTLYLSRRNIGWWCGQFYDTVSGEGSDIQPVKTRRNPQTKKHKTWEGDAVLVRCGRKSTLYDVDGRQYVHINNGFPLMPSNHIQAFSWFNRRHNWGRHGVLCRRESNWAWPSNNKSRLQYRSMFWQRIRRFDPH